jgi:hypothetical protein
MEMYQVVLGIYVIICVAVLGSAIAEYINEKVNKKL